MTRRSTWTQESGIALITALLVVMLISALMAGMFAAIQADQRSGATDRDQTQAYAAAHAGLEQLTSGLATLFNSDVSPSATQINTIASTPPSLTGFTFTAPGGSAGSGYAITFTADAQGNPQATPNADITAGAFTGFKGLITPYTMTVTARSTTGNSEVRLRRTIQTVAIPVFQFGMFSESDLSIFSGGGFAFGGRVHTNGNLFVAAQTSGTNNITFSDRITVLGEVIRNYLANGLSALTSSPSFTNNVLIPTSSSTNRNLTQSPNEGSVTDMPGCAVPACTNNNWINLSRNTYNSYITNNKTGATRLNLPLVSQGATPVDLIRRPALNSAENTANPLVYAQRYYSQASLRILLSDRVADFTGLPTVVNPGNPVLLNGVDGAAGSWTNAPPAGYGPVDATHPPIARSIGPASTTTAANSYYNAGVSQIPVAAIPAQYKLPVNMTLRAGSGTTQLISCKGKTGNTAVPTHSGYTAIAANQFLSCTVATAVAAGGATITATIDYKNYTANVVGAIAAGTVNITVGTNETAPFSPGLIWMNNPNATVANTSMPVSCEGYTEVVASSTIRFLSCRGLSAAPASGLPVTSSALANQDTGTIGGYIKIEKQDSAGNWTDVTMELLNLGIGGPNLEGTICSDPTPNAVIRIQRLRDNGGGTCTYSQSMNSYDWWPNTLYDAREGSFRDSGAVAGMTTSAMQMSGVMQYVALDVGNLKRWFAGSIGTTGTNAWDNNGYIVYFSDRRGNHDTANADVETGEFGFEDFVNSTTTAGTPDGVLQAGEDVNVGDPRWAANTQQLYGQVPWNNAVNIPTGATAPYSFAGARPWTLIPQANATTPAPGAGAARVNKVVLFRRALKLVNGGISGGVNKLPTDGLTVAAENPVYVQGDYNGTSSVTPAADWSNEEPNVPASVVADAITLLSNNWNDASSFEVPNLVTSRDATTTTYRFGAIAGKGLSFAYCSATCGNPGQLFGTDGGAANFLRMLEDWGSATTNYRGSLISLHINRQAVGAYKFNATNNHIYNAGGRNFTFDTDFLTPTLLPPGTPMFRDINTLQFRQLLRPNQ